MVESRGRGAEPQLIDPALKSNWEAICTSNGLKRAVFTENLLCYFARMLQCGASSLCQEFILFRSLVSVLTKYTYFCLRFINQYQDIFKNYL